MISLLLTGLLAAAPHVALVKRASAGVPNATSAAVIHRVGETLEQHGLTVGLEILTCPGDPSCLAQAARSASAVATVAITATRGRRQLTVDLEGVDEVERGLGVCTFELPFSGEGLPETSRVYLEKLANGLVEANRPPPDAPRVVALEPTPVARPPVEVVAPAPSRAAFKTSAALTVVSGVGSLALLTAAAVVKGSLDAQLSPGQVVRTIGRSQAQEQTGLANTLFTGSLISGALATAEVVTTGALWFGAP